MNGVSTASRLQSHYTEAIHFLPLGSQNFQVLTVTYPEFFWADRLHLGVTPPPFRQHDWRRFLNLVPPDALKMHSLAMPVLRFLCKTFSKLSKLNNETLFPVDV